MGPRENRWGWLALILSVVAHLAAVAWLWRQPAPKPEMRVVEATMIFEEPKPEEPEAEPEKPPEPEPEAPPKPQAKPQPPRAKPTPPPTAQPEVTPPPSDLPTVENDSPRAEPPPRPKLNLGLVPDSTIVLRLDAGVEPEVVMETGLRGLAAPKNIVGDLTKETLGRGRVDRGLVHPYYSQLGKALLKNWDADRVAKSGLKGLIQQTGENMKAYNEMWQERAQAYGASANPMGDVQQESNRRGAVNDRIGGVNGMDLEQRKEMQRSMREQFRATRRAIIRVVQDTNGKVTKVELVQPSNDSNVDKEALNDVRTAAQKLPPPPQEALEGKTVLSSLWSFELTVSISPPVPTFTFEFDEALGFIDARLPLDRRIYKKVRLVAVE